jgi:hypothetical protein
MMLDIDQVGRRHRPMIQALALRIGRAHRQDKRRCCKNFVRHKYWCPPPHPYLLDDVVREFFAAEPDEQTVFRYTGFLYRSKRRRSPSVHPEN